MPDRPGSSHWQPTWYPGCAAAAVRTEARQRCAGGACGNMPRRGVLVPRPTSCAMRGRSCRPCAWRQNDARDPIAVGVVVRRLSLVRIERLTDALIPGNQVRTAPPVLDPTGHNGVFRRHPDGAGICLEKPIFAVGRRCQVPVVGPGLDAEAASLRRAAHRRGRCHVCRSVIHVCCRASPDEEY